MSSRLLLQNIEVLLFGVISCSFAFPQTKEALLTILSDLNEDDYFGLVLFDDEIEPWRPSLTKATEDYVATAKEFVKTIEDRGSELIPCGHGTEPTHSICYM